MAKLLNSTVPAFIGALILGACSASHDVVTNGPIQKRKYRSGWHIDVPHRRQDREGMAKRTIAVQGSQPIEITTVTPLPLHAARAAQYDATASPSRPDQSHSEQQRPACNGQPVFLASSSSHGDEAGPMVYPVRYTPIRADGPPTASAPDRPFNWLAPTALLVAVVLPLAGILMMSTWVAVLGAAAGFVLGLTAARECRDRDMAGQGFALAAMIIGSVLLVLTLIALATRA